MGTTQHLAVATLTVKSDVGVVGRSLHPSYARPAKPVTRTLTPMTSPDRSSRRVQPTRRARALWPAAFTALLLVVTAGALSAHDLFLRPTRFFVPEHSVVRIHVLNGTFSKSEGAVTRDRLRALDLVSPAGVTPLDTAVWVPSGDTTVLTLRTGDAGTYVVGASLKPRELRLEAKDFNSYLASDGLPDVLEARRHSGDLDKPARERYHKHVKAVLQVGGRRSDGFDRVLGYPAELVPLENPYTLRPGASIRIRALVDGKPVVNQYVVAGGRTASGPRIPQRGVRTDADDVARVQLRTAGVWYVKFIHMARVAGDTTVDYESKWATLTFALR